jgi:hypothetical protein
LLCAGIDSHRLIQALSSGITYQVPGTQASLQAYDGTSGCSHWIRLRHHVPGTHWIRCITGSGSQLRHQVPGTQWIRLSLVPLVLRPCSGSGTQWHQVPGINWLRWLLSLVPVLHLLRLSLVPLVLRPGSGSGTQVLTGSVGTQAV